MRVLCLHGCAGNAKVFETQLAPLKDALRTVTGDTATFVFAEGEFDFAWPSPTDTPWVPWNPPWRSFTDAVSPSMDLEAFVPRQVEAADDLIYRLIRQQGPFDVMIGFSEGATVIASAIIHHRFANPLAPVDAVCSVAVFISGLPPCDYDCATLYVAESVGQVIQVPTVHVIGRRDVYIPRLHALRDLCEGTEAHTVEHGGAHELPRDKSTMRDLAALILRLVESASILH